MEHQLTTSKDPVVLARTHLRLAEAYVTSDTAKTSTHLREGKQLAESTGDGLARGLYHYAKGDQLAYGSNFEESLGYFDKALKSLEGFRQGPGVNDADRQDADSYILQVESSRGNIFLELYEYDTAVVIFEALLGRIEKANLPDKEIALAGVNESIALVHYQLAQYPSAQKYYNEALVHAQRAKDENMIAKTLIHIGMCQNLVGKHDSAAYHLKQAEPLVRRSPDFQLHVDYFARCAELARYTAHYKESVVFYDSTIHYAELMGDRYRAASFRAGQAKALLKDGQADKAEKIALQSLAMSMALGKKREILNVKGILASIEVALGKYREAYEFEHAVRLGDDSLRTQDRTDEIQRMDRKYQTQLKEQRIGQLEQEQKLQALELQRKNLINGMLLAGLLLAGLIAFLAVRGYRLRQEAQARRIHELEKEKQLAAVEAVLKGEERERSRLAKDLHDGLGGLLSGIKYSLNALRKDLGLAPDQSQSFDRSLDMLDSSISEMRRVAHNMMPEGLTKFGLDASLRDYCAEVDRSGALRVRYQSLGMEGVSLSDSMSITIFRIVQELLNNTMKHAKASESIVQLSHAAGTVSLTVEDDGIGFDPAKLDQRKGMGWENIRNRVSLLKGQLDIQSKSGTGTSVTVEFKN